MLSNKVESRLKLLDIKRKDFADKLNIKNTSLNTKIQKNIWTLSDIVMLAKQTNSTLCLVDKDSKEIVLAIDENDIIKAK